MPGRKGARGQRLGPDVRFGSSLRISEPRVAAGGDPVAEQVVRDASEGPQHALAAGGHVPKDEGLRRLEQQACRLARAIALDPATGRIRRARVDARQLQRAGVRDAHVAAHPRQHHRPAGGRLVEVLACRVASLRQAGVVVTLAPDPFPVVRSERVLTDLSPQVGDRVHAGRQARHALEAEPVEDRMDVRIHEARDDRAALHVHEFGPGGSSLPNLVLGANRRDRPVADEQRPGSADLGGRPRDGRHHVGVHQRTGAGLGHRPNLVSCAA